VSAGASLALPLRTERLVLRDFRADDLAAVLAYSSDPEVTRFMFYEPRDEAAARAYHQRMLASQRETPRRVFELAVERAADGRVIGNCDLTLEGPREADLGYLLARDAWGAGLATELARALVHAGFAQLGLDRIFAVCAVGHTASARVLEKAGLRHEATLHAFTESRGRHWDVDRYALLRTDWSARAP
jgi:RimJ/RimL family protein N-acetyltransferase